MKTQEITQITQLFMCDEWEGICCGLLDGL